MAEIPFCGTTIDVGEIVCKKEEFLILVAQIEILGIPYLDALLEKGIYIDINGQMRKILKERDNPPIQETIKDGSETHLINILSDIKAHLGFIKVRYKEDPVVKHHMDYIEGLLKRAGLKDG